MTTVVGRGFMKETDFHIALKIYNLGRNPEGRKEFVTNEKYGWGLRAELR